ncbi:bifunctional 4-hydroxy-2-oxoglutarate aldolase/2-dehydro-3-deoxy-phosphogluconate aldolase [Oceanibacterium hippocampi]|uniref:2-dehydro-3-deoxy-phosphogluconate aldolase n=1 Tax=Oceanibacterium hippocampi TaxID=745714 RepID=A0A1Y5TZ88_9PROT|nr:bifunctional 4-hydroxy-2-oxoglutarate aldolase/2-dehydro-3-deoxy-phosphogluconate aldolase [Oceanibacterium hippocampi]SLN74795.1 KHG/KDPG aldolase [Oceanibacterium hippocampi]
MNGIGDDTERLAGILALAPVIPVLKVAREADAAPLARALVDGGLPVIEVTLRSDAALGAIERMASVEGAVVGVGTVTRPSDFRAARDAGARFAVSPGFAADLADAAEGAGLPFLPGIATAGEAMAALRHGLRYLKFYPATAAGGIPMLKALAGPFPDLRFCPTGGLNGENFRDYLALANVVCVGGSWIAPDALVDAGDWAGIAGKARAAAG